MSFFHSDHLSTIYIYVFIWWKNEQKQGIIIYIFFNSFSYEDIFVPLFSRLHVTCYLSGMFIWLQLSLSDNNHSVADETQPQRMMMQAI